MLGKWKLISRWAVDFGQEECLGKLQPQTLETYKMQCTAGELQLA
jgi:hypothetical protein